jgi:hypothetical protein
LAVLRDSREAGAEKRTLGENAAVRSAAHLPTNRHKKALVTQSITLTESQIKGRERI